MYRHIGGNAGLLKFQRVDIDPDFCRARGERSPIVTDLANVQTRAENEQQIGVLYGEVAATVADRAGASAIERVLVPNRIMGVPTRDHGYIEFFDKPNEVGVSARETHPVSGENHGSLCISNRL